MVIDFDVLGPFMIDWNCCNLKGGLVIIIQLNQPMVSQVPLIAPRSTPILTPCTPYFYT